MVTPNFLFGFQNRLLRPAFPTYNVVVNWAKYIIQYLGGKCP